MGGIIGRLLHEFAVTIAAAILISGFVSLTLTPMLCSRFLAHKERHEHGKLFRFSERFFDGLLAVYDWGLKKVLKHRLATVFVSLLVLVATGYLFVIIPKGFLPVEDTGQLFGFTEGAQDTSYDAMYRHEKQVAKVIYTDPNIVMAMAMIGGNNANNSGRVFAHPEAAIGAQADRRTGGAGAAAKARTHPGDQRLSCRCRRPFASAGS